MQYLQAEAIYLLETGHMDEALRIWKGYQKAEGCCLLGLCDKKRSYGRCCVRRFMGKLLTLSLSEDDRRYHHLARRLDHWEKTSRDEAVDPEGTEADCAVRLSPSMMIGHPDVDEDHRLLFHALNRITVDLSGGESLWSVYDATIDLISGVDSHFCREEDLMRAVGYPEAKAHEVLHDSLRARVAGLLWHARRAESGDPKARETLGPSLIAFVFDDTLRADNHFKTFLQSESVAFC